MAGKYRLGMGTDELTSSVCWWLREEKKRLWGKTMIKEANQEDEGLFTKQEKSVPRAMELYFAKCLRQIQ